MSAETRVVCGLIERWINRLIDLVPSSDHHSPNDCASNWEVILLSSVVVVRGYRMTVGKTSPTGPPADGRRSLSGGRSQERFAPV